jgi:hypothetical protein
MNLFSNLNLSVQDKTYISKLNVAILEHVTCKIGLSRN